MNAKASEMRPVATDLDRSDARRIIEATVTICSIPGMASSAARDIAALHLRAMLTCYPRQTDVLFAIIQYLESYPS